MIWWLAAVLAIALLLFSSRYGWWRKKVADKRPRILMYHMVSEHRGGAKFNKLRVTPGAFEQQVGWLANQGYHFAFMSELAAPETLPAKTVAITFDDGYEDNFLHAHPVLQRYGARATLYLVEARFDRDWSVYKKRHHDTGELRLEPKLSDLQVSKMIASGTWELGGHTATHANLKNLDSATKQQEIADSKRRLEEKFATRLSSFAYPFGIYSEADIPIVEAAGFDTAVTTEEGIDEDLESARFRLKRIKVSGKDNWLAFRLRMRSGVRG